MWLKLVLALCVLVPWLHGALRPNLGKIFNGQLADVRDYPYLVNLRRGGNFKCGGALITPRCVLTAAHCLQGRPNQVWDLSVHAQQQCLRDEIPPEHVRQAQRAWVSPGYRNKRLDFDIGLIRLSEPFTIGGNISTLPVDYNDLPAGANLTIVGWGATQSQGFDWNQCLQAANVSLVSNCECNELLHQFQPITQNMFCALGENRKDACPGDSGSPIIYANRAAGVVSWGIGCGQGYPGVYTRHSSLCITTFLKDMVQRYC